MAPATTLKKGKYSTLGSARKSVDLERRFPETTALSLDFYLLGGPLMKLLTCNVPEVDTEEEYLEKAKQLASELTSLAKRLEALA